MASSTQVVPPAWVFSYIDETCKAVPVILMLNLIRAGTLLYRQMEDYLFSYGLTLPQGNVLWTLNARSPDAGMPITEIANSQGVSKANMTGIIDRMEREGLVRRVADPSDRRVTLIEMTDKAKILMQTLTPTYDKHVAEMLNNILTEQEQAQMIQMMVKLRQSLGD
jgi:MarR family transcriptional regulator, 2-MHQ and catechol-resistance regulon repressor